MKTAVLVIVLLLAACATDGSSTKNFPRTEHQASIDIFRVVLQGWLDRNERGNAIYVAETTYSHPFPEKELKNFLACANSNGTVTKDLAFEPRTKIAGSISNPRLHFISPRSYRPPPPERISDIIKEGRPVGIINLTSVAFDRDKTIAVLHFSTYCGSLCGYGETLVLDKTASGWVQRPKTCDGWMS